MAVKDIEELFLAQDYEKVIEEIEKLSEEDKANPKILNILGMMSIDLQDFMTAKNWFLRAMQGDTKNTDYMYNYAYASANVGDYNETKAAIERCLQHSTSEELNKDVQSLLEIFDNQDYTGKKALMIAYYYPPIGGSGVFRSIKLSKYLPSFNWHTDVVCAKAPPKYWSFSDESLVQEIPQGSKVYRIEDEAGIGKIDEVSIAKANKTLEFLLRDAFKYEATARDIISTIIKNNEYSLLMSFPDTTLLWTIEAIEYIEKNIDLSKYDLIYTTSGPYSAHIVGSYFKSKINIPWVADFRDPWTTSPYGHIEFDKIGILLFQLEKIVLKLADGVVNVSEGISKLQRDTFNLPKSKARVIPNGYDEEDFKNIVFKKETNKKFTIAYSGTLYMTVRSMEPFFKTIGKLIRDDIIPKDKICIKIMSNPIDMSDMLKEYGLKNNVELLEYGSLRQSIDLCVQSDLLLCLVGDEDKYKDIHTSKFFNYLRTGVRIMAYAPLDGAVDEILKESGQGITVQSTDEKTVYEKILQEYSEWENSKEKTYNIHESISKFDRKIETGQMAAFFDEILCKNRENYSFEDETPRDIYDGLYKASSSYHQHYTQSMYYSTWQVAIKYLLPMDKSTNVIDIGCGSGQFANMVIDNGFLNYRGLDFSDVAIDMAKKALPEYKDSFVVGDAFTSDIFNTEYDLVVMFEILEHLKGDLELLKRIKSKAKVMLSVPNFTDPNHVRYFDTETAVSNRYSGEIDIKEIYTSTIRGNFKIFIIIGNKK